MSAVDFKTIKVKEDVIKTIKTAISKICEQNQAPPRPTYEVSYPYLLQQGKAVREKPTAENIVVLAHAVYGWMPTILNMFGDDCECTEKITNGLCDICKIVAYLQNKDIVTWFDTLYKKNKKEREQLEEIERLKKLANFTNNSFVGLSKFLHFIFQDKIAIFDSNVLENLRNNGADLPAAANNVNAFVAYEKAINEYRDDFNKENSGKQVSLRDIEIQLFIG